MSRTIRRALALAVTACACTPMAAEAAVTQSNVTSPGNPTYRLWNDEIPDPDQTIGISGTTNGTGGDLVDLRCFYGDDYVTIQENVAVAANGTFSHTEEIDNFGGQACIIRAIPDGYSGSELFSYAGPLVSITKWEPNSSTIPVNGGGTATRDYWLESGHRRGQLGLYSAGSDGIYDFYGVRPHSLGEYDEETWSYGAAIYRSNYEGDRAAIEVDGRAAYNAYGTPRFDYDGGGPLPTSAPTGFTGVHSTVTVDPATGVVTVIESQQIRRCSGTDDNNGVTSLNCPSVLDTGIRHERTITFTQEHAVVDVRDRWISSDGAQHQVRVEYYNDGGYDEHPLWKFPGDPAFTYYNDPDMVIPGGPGTVLLRDSDSEGGYDMAPGALSYNPAPAYFYFASYHYLPEVSNLTVPAGGDTPVRRVFAVGPDSAAAAALGNQAEDSFAGPTVTISGPANGSTTTTPAATVIGKAVDNKGVKSLTVNGAAAGMGADGSFSVPVTLAKGSNKITVAATDGAGLTTTAQVDVTLVDPPAVVPAAPPAVKRCVVPKVRAGSTLSSVRKALTKANCKAARTAKKVRSRTVRKGRVHSLTRKAGTSLPQGTAIGIKVSRGRR